MLLAATVMAALGAEPCEAGRRTPSCPLAADTMGEAITYGGDFDGDGIADLAAASPCSMVIKRTHAGRVTVFSGADDGKKIFSAKGQQKGQFMGLGLAFVDDLDGDGRDELIVGSPGFDVTETEDPTVEAGKKLKQAGRIDVLSCLPQSCTSDQQCPRGSCGTTGQCVDNEHRTICGTEVLDTWYGSVQQAMLGKSVAALDNDTLCSGEPCIVAGAPGDRVERAGGKRGQRKGRIYLYELSSESPVNSQDGPGKGSRFGKRIASIGDVDGDLQADILTGSDEAGSKGAKKGGLVTVLSGADMEPLVTKKGAKKDRLGAAVADAGDMDGDGRSDFIAGSSTSDDSGFKNSGTVTVFSANGDTLLVAEDPGRPKIGALFGSAVVRLGDINDDGIDDFAVGSPDWSTRSAGTKIKKAGRVVAISGADGSEIWKVNGSRPGQRLGQTLAAGPDSGQGHVNLLAAAPGDAPQGRRGAGTVKELAGRLDEGKSKPRVVKTYRGARGLETRLFVFGLSEARLDRASPDTARPVPVALSFGTKGNDFELRSALYGDKPTGDVGDLSLALLDDNRSEDPGGHVKVVVASGRVNNTEATGAASVRVLDARADDTLLASFEGLPKTPKDVNGGVNVAAGRLDRDPLHPSRYQEKIVVAQADAGDADNVLVRIFERVRPRKDDQWVLEHQFNAFSPSDLLSQEFNLPAKGAYVAVGDVVGDDKLEEIIVGTAAGVPMVRVFSAAGAKLAEWLAYHPDSDNDGSNDTFGVRVAVGRLTSDSTAAVLTVPALGKPLIRAFDGYGSYLTGPGSEDAFEIDPTCDTAGTRVESEFCVPTAALVEGAVVAEVAAQVTGTDYCSADADCAGGQSCYSGPSCLDPAFARGGYVTAANLDFDKVQEIVFVPGRRDENAPLIMAFEMDGSPVRGFKQFHPLKNSCRGTCSSGPDQGKSCEVGGPSTCAGVGVECALDWVCRRGGNAGNSCSADSDCKSCSLTASIACTANNECPTGETCQQGEATCEPDKTCFETPAGEPLTVIGTDGFTR